MNEYLRAFECAVLLFEKLGRGFSRSILPHGEVESLPEPNPDRQEGCLRPELLSMGRPGNGIRSTDRRGNHRERNFRRLKLPGRVAGDDEVCQKNETDRVFSN